MDTTASVQWRKQNGCNILFNRHPYRPFQNGSGIINSDSVAQNGNQRRLMCFDKKHRAKICLILTVILLLIAIALFAATAVIGAKELMSEKKSDVASNEIKVEETAAPEASKSIVDHFKNSNDTAEIDFQTAELATLESANASFSQTVDRVIRINNSPGWTEASRNILAGINFDTDPCHDFYKYACGVWPFKYSIGPNRSSHTVYTSVRKRVFSRIRSEIERLDIDDQNIPNSVRMVRLIYDICIDHDRMTNEGSKALLKLLNDPKNGIGNWPLISTDQVSIDFASTIGILKRDYGVDTVIYTNVGPDSTTSSENVLHLNGLVLPLGLGKSKAHYYLNQTKYGHVMQAYANLINDTANLLLKTAGSQKQVNFSRIFDIFDFERELADHVFKSNPDSCTWTLRTLMQNIPSLDWKAYFHSLLPPDSDRLLDIDRLRLDISSKQFLINVASLLSRTDPVTIQNYLIWRLIKSNLPYLGGEYRMKLFALNSLMTGGRKSKSIVESCIDYLQDHHDLPSLGYATGRIFIDQAFSYEEKQDVRKMADAIINASQVMIQNLDWMDDITKQEAMEKVRNMKANMGYPDWIKNDSLLDAYYSNLSIIPNDTMLEVNLRLRSWSVMKNQMQLFMPIDRSDFEGPPAATNAWYNVNYNSLTIPAGELQSPFYKITYPMAMNYGAVGSVIGHEIMHGFDKKAGQYDSKGIMRKWWSQAAMEALKNRTECLARQYDQYCYPRISGGLCIDGQRTVAENAADLGGLKAAYSAYKNMITDSESSMSLPGPAMYFNHDQLFFLSFASFWCGSSKMSVMKEQLTTGRHATAKYRVIGTLRNFPEFTNAFQCPKNSFMNPERKCDIW